MGILIFLLTLLGLIGGLLFVRHSVMSKRPLTQFGRFFVTCLPGAHLPADFVPEMLRLSTFLTRLTRSQSEIWIEVVPRDADLTVTEQSGKKIPVHGTVKLLQWHPFHRIYFVQVREAPTFAEMAIVHEVLEHVLPLMVVGQGNHMHDPKWAKYTHDFNLR